MTAYQEGTEATLQTDIGITHLEPALIAVSDVVIPLVGQRYPELDLIDGLQAGAQVLGTLDAETIGTAITFTDLTSVQGPAFVEVVSLTLDLEPVDTHVGFAVEGGIARAAAGAVMAAATARELKVHRLLLN